MDAHCWKLLVMLLWSMNVEGLYHTISMQYVPAPSNVTGESLFGYSIAFQQATKSLIISAPNKEIGKVYDCNIQNKHCEEIVNTVQKDYLSVHGKMWLGATVATGPDYTMACAPRYIEEKAKTGTFGKCFVTSATSHNMTIMKNVTVAEKEKHEVVNASFETYMDSLGWSIDVTRNGSILVGGPAMYRGRAVEYSSIDAEPQLLNFAVGADDSWHVNFNFGYSITSGNFKSGNKNEVVYAVSSPYGKMGLGLVVMYDGVDPWALPQPQTHSPHVGALFGAAMAPASLFRGQAQSLLVGAPAFARLREGQFDVGAVYVYQTRTVNEKEVIMPWKTLLGKVNGGRFGSAIANLGDLNGDNRDEVAIAAPYEGSGAIYIYSGEHLIRRDYSIPFIQKIAPKLTSGYTTFGLSLTVLTDYDENGCNGLAIGAPESNRVAVLRCMASITVSVAQLQEKQELPKFPRARRNETYFVFQSCLDITYPAKPTTLSAEIEVKVSITHASAQLVGSRDDGTFRYTKSIRDRTENHLCEDVGIIMPEVGRDRMIQYEITAVQLSSPATQEVFNASRVLLSDLSKLVTSDTVWVADCEGLRECRPKFENVTIHSTIANNHIIGAPSTGLVSASALNAGDAAYGACLRIRIAGASVLRYPPSCSYPQGADALECTPKMPVKKNAYWQTEEIELDMKNLKSDSKEISIKVDLFPECSKVASSIPKVLTVKLRPDPAEMLVRGSTNIGNTVELTSDELKDTGKQMSHDYSIYNFGVTDWVNIQCEITLQNKLFFKTFDMNVESVPYQCTAPEEVKGGKYRTVCTIEELKKNQKFVVMLPIYILPGKLDQNNLQKDNLTVFSHLRLIYGKNKIEKSITSSLRLKASPVPLWVIIIAALVGLLIICVIVFALYECGYLRRKNKDKLMRLRKSVYRQSVRRSQMRDSIRSAQRRSSDKAKLVEGRTSTDDDKLPPDVQFEELTDDNDVCGNPEEKKKEEKKGEKKEEKKDEIKQTNGRSSVTQDKVHLKTLPEEDEECKIKKKEQIIRGLQKNIKIHRSNQFLSAPSLAEKNKDSSEE